MAGMSVRAGTQRRRPRRVARSVAGLAALALGLVFGLAGCAGSGSARVTGAVFDPIVAEGEAFERPPIPHYTCRRASGPIVIDGNLNEKAWKHAGDIGPFYNWDGRPLNPDTPPVTVQMVYDDEALYIGWHCLDPNIVGTLTEHDGPLWNEDVVEVYLDPGNDLEDYYELIVNPINTVLDTCQWTGEDRLWPGRHELEWTARGLETATRIRGRAKASGDPPGGDTAWTVEMRLPFTLFDKEGLTGAPDPGTVWRMQLTRYDGHDAANPGWVHLCWSPVYLEKHPHQVDYFGYLHFGAESAARPANR